MLNALTADGLSTDERVALWERQTRWWIVVAALAPFVVRVIPGDRPQLDLTIDLTTWAVFAVDFGVHLRIQRDYWRTGRGVFDVSILVFTFPWYVFPAVGNTAFTMVFRWARLARLLFATPTGRRLLSSMRRLGTLGVVLAFTSVLSALILLQNEPPSAGFRTFGDALWWAMVTFTTVGYGDLYPTTTAGRVAGGLMMFMGLVALGTVSGVLASAFMDDRDDEAGAGTAEVRDELRALREELAELRRQLASGEATGEDGSR